MGVRPTPEGHIHLINPEGRKVWGTDEPPVQLVRSAWQEIPITIEFPDFPTDVAYFFDRVTEKDAWGEYMAYYGMSVTKILPQELTLPDVILGTVPSDKINYVDWRVVLEWTKKPSSARGWPIMSPIVRGKQADLRGGSAVMEISGGIQRMIHLSIVGQNIVLSRKQSTRGGDWLVNWKGNPQTDGWTYGTSPEGLLSHYIGGTVGHPSYYLGGAYRGGERSAPLTDPTDYSSTWTGTLFVKPGRINASI
ncbi:MAG: hypothetical protein ABS75_18515 [Pelagibacterium sp. SCN 63-23]|nr:MAG: hypothetical protein ABS75_18515 [Pelagibacterium sp. SCN 63-23]